MFKNPTLLIITILAILRIALFVAFSEADRNTGESQQTFMIFDRFIRHVTSSTQNTMPKIHADLLLGMTIGVDSVKQDKMFYQNLVTTGMVHVVVVSGYNVALVISFITNIFYKKLKTSNKFYVFTILALYVIICGMQPPVIRAALMGYVVYLASTYGRALEALPVLLFVCLSMLIIYPFFIISLSFWLSTLATLGLIFFQKCIQFYLSSLFKSTGKFFKYIPLEDLSSSLACQITVWPVISLFFGRVSALSPIYNMFVLWLVPMCTVLGFAYLITNLVVPSVAALLLYLVLPFYDLFIKFVDFFAFVDRGSISLKVSPTFLVVYYIAIYLLIYLKTKLIAVANKTSQC